ncbi:MAG: hemerythrin domain-containing protein [Undibacterium sp.]|nr:hemerythrin domain-containing protein [Undibacterium sp.]
MSNQPWKWSDRLSLQHAEIDATHQEFVSLCAALSHDDGLDFIQKLDALIAHTLTHFEQENQWMRETHFPPAGCHQTEHETVLQLMQEVRLRVIDGELDLGQRLAEELPHWFEHHVDTMDNMLARHLLNVASVSA